MLKYRNIFVAKNGHSFIKADYEQMELRMASVISNDKSLIADFNNHVDIHLRTARECFDLPIPDDGLGSDMLKYKGFKDKYCRQRNIAKFVNFGIIYGMTRWGLASRLGVGVNSAQKYLDTFFFLYPDIGREKQRCARQVERKGYAVSLFGRRRRFAPGEHKAADKAFHFRVCGSCADIMRLAMVSVNSFYKDVDYVRPVLTVHDEMVYECRDVKVEECAPKIKEISESCVSFAVPLLIDIKICKEYE